LATPAEVLAYSLLFGAQLLRDLPRLLSLESVRGELTLLLLPLRLLSTERATCTDRRTTR
jgi:hypothetical protein